ncbi:Uncharacterised protein [Vibrio cholerae]|nr:Uncharacterised protein [Vibrio cholerae]
MNKFGFAQPFVATKLLLGGTKQCAQRSKIAQQQIS